MYKLHFHFSRSSRYPQAVELAELANTFKTRNWGEKKWHVATFRPDQLDLLAAVYELAVGRFLGLREEDGRPVFETALRHLKEINEVLQEAGYYCFNEQGRWSRTEKPIPELIDNLRRVKEHIGEGDFAAAVESYYDGVSSDFDASLRDELLYLKRLAETELAGRDLLSFRPPSSRSEIVSAHLLEYVGCLDECIDTHLENYGQSLIDIFLVEVPTLDELIQETSEYCHSCAYIWDGKVKVDSTIVTPDFFGTYAVPKGRLFSRYTTPLHPWRSPDRLATKAGFRVMDDPERLWILCSEAFIEENVYSKGLRLAGVELYRNKAWKRSSQEPPFQSITRLDETVCRKHGVLGLAFTGKTHEIEGQMFYEVFKPKTEVEETGGPSHPWHFLDLVGDIHREAENLLRERHGVPRIGEGWVSEMRVFDLVKAHFSDAKHHCSPRWLKPQHLDVFIPGEKFAIEYQGVQHYEAVDFFGGAAGLAERKKLDARKRRLCKKNDCSLIEWRHDEPIDMDTLISKLLAVGIDVT